MSEREWRCGGVLVDVTQVSLFGVEKKGREKKGGGSSPLCFLSCLLFEFLRKPSLDTTRPQVPFLMHSELADSLNFVPQSTNLHDFTTPSESATCLRTTWRTRSGFFPSKFNIPCSILEIAANEWLSGQPGRRARVRMDTYQSAYTPRSPSSTESGDLVFDVSDFLG